jgi:hypothetical protein
MKRFIFAVVAAVLAIGGPRSALAQSGASLGVPVRIWAKAQAGVTTGQTLNTVLVQFSSPPPPYHCINLGGGLWYVLIGHYEDDWYLFGCYTNNPPASYQLSGNFMPSSPNGTDGNYTASGAGITNYQQFDVALGNSGISHLEVGKSYTVNVSSTNVIGASLNVGVPAGYEVIINGVRRKSIALTYGSAVISVLPRGDGPPGAAGFASSVSASSVDWRVSLGGFAQWVGSRVAPACRFRSHDRRLGYARDASLAQTTRAVSDEVYVYREDNIIKQIIANQVALDVVPNPNGTSYEIRCYNPAQGTGTAPTTFEGDPFAVYRVALGSTATSLNFTKESREIMSLSATGVAIARTEVMALKREGAWPNFQWTKDDWTLSGQTPLARVIVKGELKPVILIHPAGKAVVAGSSATLSVTGSGVPAPNYQWKKNGAAITGNTTATQPTLHITNAQAGDAAAYTVTLTNTLDTVTSVAANLAVYSAPSGIYAPIVNAPAGAPFGVCRGQCHPVCRFCGKPGAYVSMVQGRDGYSPERPLPVSR